MATYRGNTGIVKIGSDTVAEIMEFSVDEVAATTPDTVMGDTWETHLGGLQSWTGSVSCRFDHTDTTGQNALAVGASVTVNFYPTGDAATNQLLTGTATVVGVNQNQSFENTTVMRSFQVQGNGALTKSIIS